MAGAGIGQEEECFDRKTATVAHGYNTDEENQIL
jgi:hypothetical protein